MTTDDRHHVISMPDTFDNHKREVQFDKGVLKITAQKKTEAIKAEKKTEIQES